MSQEQLASFISQSRAAGKADEIIKQELLAAGWQEQMVSAALTPVSTNVVPIPTEGTDVYAGFWHRAAASVADGILLSLASFIIAIPLAGLDLIGLFPSEVIFSILLVLVNIGLWFAYYPFMEAKKGQTFGKQFIGIKVIKDDTRQLLSLGRSCGRSLSKILSALPLGIGFLMAAFTKKKQALHDIIVESVVVRTPRVSNSRTALTLVLGIFGPMLFVIFIVPLIITFMFGAILGGFVTGMEGDMEYSFEPSQYEDFSNEFTPSTVPVALTAEELDSYMSSAIVTAIVEIEPESFAEGYVQAGPVIITWNDVWNDEVVAFIPALQGIAFSDYMTVDITEVIDNTGTNVYVPAENFGSYTGIYWSTYEIDGVPYNVEEAGWDFGSVESFEPMQRVRGTVRFIVPLDSGETYERSFEFDLTRQ